MTLYTFRRSFRPSLSLRSSLNISVQVSHRHKTTGKIIFLYILILKFLDSSLEDKRFCTEWLQAFTDINLLLISSWIEFWSVKALLKHLNSSTLSNQQLSVFILWLRLAFRSRDFVFSAFTSSPDSCVFLYTVIPRLTKISRSGITFVSRNVILYKLYKYIIHFILLNWRYVHNVFTVLLPNFQSLFKVSSWNGPTVHVCCFMLARASTKTLVSRIHIR